MSHDTQPLWTAAEVRAAAHAPGPGDWTATGVAIDSRAVGPGDLFVAIAGEKFDGHDFAADALAKGAVAVVAHKPIADNFPVDRVVMVEDTLRALERLGIAARDRARGTVIGVTGSVGKTGSKEALARGLGLVASTYSSAGGLNNHVGLPLSLSRVPPAADYVVLEMGMNHAGELRALTGMARPEVAMITTIAPAHMEFFADLDAVADAKAEIFESLPSHGRAVLNHDIPQFGRLAARVRELGISEIVSFGRAKSASARLIDAEAGVAGSAVTADVSGTRISYRVALPGAHHIQNSLAVLATAFAAGADPARIAPAFAEMAPMRGRGAQLDIDVPGGKALLIDESYNNSPEACRAALAVLGAAPARRRVAVLGDMLEQGEKGPGMHRALAREVLSQEVDRVYTIGPLMAELFAELPADKQGISVSRSQDVIAPLLAALRPDDAVLVKGSLGMNLAPIVAALLADREATKSDGGGVPESSAATNAER